MRRINANRSKKNRARRRTRVAVKSGGRAKRDVSKPGYGFIEPEKSERGSNRDIETDVRKRGSDIENDEMDRSMDVTERPPRKQDAVEGRPDQLAGEDEDVERMQGESDESVAERASESEGDIEEGDEESRSGHPVNPEEEDELKRRRKYNRPDDRTNAPE
jgi:hypothetical protein